MNYFKKWLVSAMLVASPFIAFPQFSISGRVKTKVSNDPIPGATIRINKTFIVAQSRNDGRFEIPGLKEGKYILEASYIGFQTRIDTIELTENKTIGIELSENEVLMDEVVVQSTRVDNQSGMAYSTINKEEIAEQNLGQDLPYLLNQQTSVVTTSDAGAGVGYTGIRIRGSDATRVNVTINGIPVNDAESQGTYWVDLPDIASSIDNIQLQRGVGTSTNGAGAFGGSLNIQTTKLNPVGYGEYNGSAGSFNTFKNTVNAGSGLINNKFAMDVRLSAIQSAGFIDRAKSDLKSYYLSGAYYGKKNIIKFITFSGQEETYQAWNGIPESRLNDDPIEMHKYVLRNALDDDDTANLYNSGSRTYNEFSYSSQVDHYKQDYYQLHFAHEFNSKWNANIALHYTKGKGYYEEYRKNDAFINYGLQDVIIGTDTITSTNLVRRRWLDNDFYGTVFSLNYNSNKRLAFTLGGAWNEYKGLHYGEIIWAQYASNGILHNNYYNDTATKTDFNIYLKANYKLFDRLNVSADLQYRMIDYSFLGFDNNLANIQQQASLSFINPKVGFNYIVNSSTNFYASYSLANKEPSRDDYTQSTPNSRPKAETLNDIEIGAKSNLKKMMFGLNFYFMNYKNQLVLTGQVNDVGAYNRTNVDKSFRQGIEAEIGVKILKNLEWTINGTFSQNKILDFYEYIDNYDSTAQRVNHYDVSDIAFSPSVIAGSTITFEPIKNLKFSFISKYVDKQFLDNTSNDARKLDAYFTNDIRINYTLKIWKTSEIGFTFAVNNIFSTEYESNGYTYGYIYGGEHIVENFYYPQAGINAMGGIRLKF